MIIVFNSGSGQKKGSEPLTTALASAGIQAQVLAAESGQELERFAAEAARGSDDVVVAAGGDGTINTVASALVGTGKTMGVLPLGTFNFFARRLQIPLDLDEAVEVLASAQTATLDLGEVNGRIFINNSSVGLYPATLRERERAYRKFGRNRLVAYIAGAVALVRQSRRSYHMRLTIDGEECRVQSQFVFVCNNRDQLELYQIRGAECLAAGKLAVYTAPPLRWTQMLGLGARMLFRQLRQAEEYIAICASDLQIESRRPRVEVALDGERIPLKPPLRYRMRKDALRVLVPAGQ